MIPDKLFVPHKTEPEKLAEIDSCIESAIKILKNEIKRRADLSTEAHQYHYHSQMVIALRSIEDCHKHLIV
jgi:hypothetical protein